MRPPKIRTILFILIAASLIAPITIYMWRFGLSISANHTRWAEMGSAMEGIYSPILSIITVSMLLVQLHLQREINNHAIDQAFTQNSRDDIHFYLDHLAAELREVIYEETTVKEFLISNFAYLEQPISPGPTVTDGADMLNKKHRQVLATWSGFNTVLAGLKANDFHPYSTSYISAKQRATAVISYDCCVALDNFSLIASIGELKYSEFSNGHGKK